MSIPNSSSIPSLDSYQAPGVARKYAITATVQDNKAALALFKHPQYLYSNAQSFNGSSVRFYTNGFTIVSADKLPKYIHNGSFEASRPYVALCSLNSNIEPDYHSVYKSRSRVFVPFSISIDRVRVGADLFTDIGPSFNFDNFQILGATINIHTGELEISAKTSRPPVLSETPITAFETFRKCVDPVVEEVHTFLRNTTTYIYGTGEGDELMLHYLKLMATKMGLMTVRAKEVREMFAHYLSGNEVAMYGEEAYSIITSHGRLTWPSKREFELDLAEVHGDLSRCYQYKRDTDRYLELSVYPESERVAMYTKDEVLRNPAWAMPEHAQTQYFEADEIDRPASEHAAWDYWSELTGTTLTQADRKAAQQMIAQRS